MKHINNVLNKIKDRCSCGLLQIIELACWGFPESKKSDTPYDFPINAKTLELLSECVNLKKMMIVKGLDLLSCTITEFRKLANCINLELIEIDHTSLPNEAIVLRDGSLASVLECTPKLRSLRLRGVDGSIGSSILPKLGTTNINLERLRIWLKKGTISDAELVSLKPLKNLKELILSSCTSSGSREAFKTLRGLPLSHLGLFYSENSNLTDDDFNIILEIPTLSSLNIGGWNLNDNTLVNLSNATKLTNFSISRVLLTSDGMRHISNCKTITLLRISAISCMVDNDLIPLQELDLLQLTLDNLRAITDTALMIISHHRTLTELKLNSIPKLTNTGILGLHEIPNLKQVLISNCGDVS
jgi:hypothetical protein